MQKYTFRYGVILLLIMQTLSACSQQNKNKKSEPMKFKQLTVEEERVIVHKGTEMPYSGEYYTFDGYGTYVCKRCEAPLYKSTDKFDAQCGWPSFDDEIPGAILRKTDADGRRTEILCAKCGAHLGHVFEGEHFTEKNTRHCVNSISLSFKPMDINKKNTETAIFAGGCFWGVEYYLQKKQGVISTTVGYIGGQTENPTYQDVCSHTSGHIEAVEVIFDPVKVSYEELAKVFFEIHDPTQVNRQGPDIGEQYRSEVFYTNENQKETILKLINILEEKGLKIATELRKASKFWPAENYHQDYYNKKGGIPYCHRPEKRF